MTKTNLIGLYVLMFLVVGITLTAYALGVPSRTISTVTAWLWIASSLYVYHFICIRNRERFALYVKLTSKGGKGPGLFEKSLVLMFGPYWGWSHGVWPAIVRKFGPKPVQPRKNV